jgi:23S rRNA pseudouridine2605 synthase
MGTRLNKYLAQCGLGSRRTVESLISAGRITVNGRKIVRLATIIEPGDRIEFDGRPVARKQRPLYIMLNKPSGYITTLHDEKNRPTVMDLIPEKYKRLGVYPVGRLDRDTSGLLLLTNDGDLAYRLMRPAFHVQKEYLVEIDRPLADEDRLKITKGVYIHQLDIKAGPARVDCVDASRRRVRVVITEGKNRQIRYTFFNLNYRIKSLERTAYGTITMKHLKKGALRELNGTELKTLRTMTGLDVKESLR